ncbi:hypothetical protein [Marinobacter salarius]|uniref:hypothetical protein n=1 Tax=Marinobacter salarius TaxID=1420917 RepID=UPI003D9C492D
MVNILSAYVSLTHFFRILGLVGRAGTIFILASLIAPDDMAVFGLVSSYAAVFVILNGLDVTRSFQSQIKRKESYSQLAPIIGTVFNFLVIVSLLFSIFSFLLRELFPFELVVLPLFILLVVFEHFAQEAGRILIVMNFHYQNSIGILIRSFLPMFVFCLFFIFGAKFNVVFAIIVMVSCACASTVYTWVILVKNFGFSYSFDGRQIFLIMSSVKASIFFFAATLIGKVFFAIDKTLIENWFGPDYLASYILVLGVSMVVVPLVEIFVGSYALPKFYEVSRARSSELRRAFRYFFLKAAAFSTVYITLAITISNYLLFLVFPDYHELKLLEIIFISLVPYVFSLNIIPTYCLASGDKSFLTFMSSVPSFIAMLFYITFSGFGFKSFLAFFLLCFVVVFLIRLYFATRHAELLGVGYD